jgi:hypothetical protein
MGCGRSSTTSSTTEGRTYFDRRKAAGKTSMEAMRSLKRRLSDIVYRTTLSDTLGASPGGQRGNDPHSSATGLASPHQHFGKATTRTRQPKPTTRPPRRLLTEGSHERAHFRARLQRSEPRLSA